MIRRASASVLPGSGLEGSASPFSGSTRMMLPSRVVGSAGRAPVLGPQRPALAGR